MDEIDETLDVVDLVDDERLMGWRVELLWVFHERKRVI
jgi:hypothetical protein